MLKFLGRKREQPPPAPWMKWLVILFLLFIIASSMHKEKPGQASPMHEAMQQAEQNLKPSKLINFGEYKDIFLSSYGSQMRMRDTAPGHGNPVVCGQQVAIAYITYDTESKKLPDEVSKDKPLTFRIGDGNAMPVFEEGIGGMKEGGARSILAPSNMAYGIPAFAKPGMPANASIRFDIDLLSVKPALPDFAATPYRIAQVRNGLGQPIQCGEPAKVSLTLWSVDGKKLYASPKPVTFTPGKSEVFLGLEQGVLGLTKGGLRTLVVPPAFQKTMDGSAPAVAFPFPKNQTVLVDVESVP